MKESGQNQAVEKQIVIFFGVLEVGQVQVQPNKKIYLEF